MPTDVIMPALGMAQETGKVLRWLKAEGQPVTKGEPLLEIETDKATVEVEAPASGELSGITAAAGADVPVGHVIARILAADEARQSALDQSTPVRASGRIAASPKARRLARERGIDLAAAIPTGSGPSGAVLAADVLTVPQAAGQAGPAGQAAPVRQAPQPEQPASVSSVWRLMAERTTQAWTTVPHFFLLREVHAGRLVTWREQYQKRFRIEVTHTDLLTKLVAAALREHPYVNARWEGNTAVPTPEINVGIAVATEGGLVVPVIHGADRLSLREIAERRAGLVARTRDRKLRPEDLRGGTFTISNLGMYGIDAFTAIINAPQAAILAVGRIAPRVVPVGGRPGVRPTIILSLSCDHRAVDGARGAQFLTALADLIEEPLGLLD